METIKTGDYVRSFDFEFNRELTGERAAYVEGYVEDDSWTPLAGGYDCERYKIRVCRRVFGGEELADHPSYVYPPVNGVPIAGSDKVTDGVFLMRGAE